MEEKAILPPTKNLLRPFIGKVCTIFTVPINRNFKEENPGTFTEQVFNYFTGRVLETDAEGVLLEQLTPERLRSYFCKQHIIAICQEEELNPNNPEHAKKIAELKKESVAKTELKKQAQAKLAKEAEIPPSGQFMDINAMNAFSEQMQNQSRNSNK